MNSIDQIGANVRQGGSRRSAIYASINWQHGDARKFLYMKDWHNMPIAGARKEDGSQFTVWDAKMADFNYKAPLDMTNISLNYDDQWLNDPDRSEADTFKRNVAQACQHAEPGFSFNFGVKQNETLRNACTEVSSEDDGDVCNLGSANMGAIESIEEFKDIVNLAGKFLICGTIRAVLPYEKIYKIREKNRRLGLGIMGVHEWLLRRDMPYEVTPELHKWLGVYREESERGANEHADRLYCSRPVAYRAIAPTGTIGILAGTTTGIEPLLSVAFKRRYLVDGTRWKYEYVIDSTAEYLIKEGTNPEKIETAYQLAEQPEARIKFQADVQDYVDMCISSTINLPAWGTKHNNPDTLDSFGNLLSKYAPRLRGFTCYPDGSRGGQPITEVPYKDAVGKTNVVYEETPDICEISGHGGVCGN